MPAAPDRAVAAERIRFKGARELPPGKLGGFFQFLKTFSFW
jgi:hypothetical protein